MTWEKWILIANFALAGAFNILLIDRPRKPVTTPVALVAVMINLFMIALVVLA